MKRPPVTAAIAPAAALGLALALALLLVACDAGKPLFTKAAQAEAAGSWEEATHLYEEVCTTAASSPLCATAGARAARDRVRAAWRAIDEGQYAKAKSLLAGASASSDDTARQAAAAASRYPALVQGLAWEEASALPDKRKAREKIEQIAELDVAVAVQAREWLEKNRPAVLLEDVKAACSPKGAGSCSDLGNRLAKLHSSSAGGAEAKRLVDAEYARVYPLLKDAEALLAQRAALYDREQKIVGCIARSLGEEDISRYACENEIKSPVVLPTVSAVISDLKTKLEEIRDPAYVKALTDRWARAEISGEYDPQPWPAPVGR